jgi:hypothetical protein
MVVEKHEGADGIAVAGCWAPCCRAFATPISVSVIPAATPLKPIVTAISVSSSDPRPPTITLTIIKPGRLSCASAVIIPADAIRIEVIIIRDHPTLLPNNGVSRTTRSRNGAHSLGSTVSP